MNKLYIILNTIINIFTLVIFTMVNSCIFSGGHEVIMLLVLLLMISITSFLMISKYKKSKIEKDDFWLIGLYFAYLVVLSIVSLKYIFMYELYLPFYFSYYAFFLVVPFVLVNLYTCIIYIPIDKKRKK